MARKSQISIPSSKMKEALAQVLFKEGFIGKVAVSATDKVKKRLSIQLRYVDKMPSITGVVKVSTPGRRMYVEKNSLSRIMRGIGTIIVSTPEGIMSGKQARKKGLGGEIICKIW